VSGAPVETLLAVTAAMLLVLALRRPVARAFGADWAYALWLIPALRLMLPSLGLVTADHLLPPAAFIPAAGGGTALPPAVAAGLGQWAPFMLASWAGGAVLFLILQWLAYRAFVARLDTDARPARPPVYEGVATFVSRVVEGPVALGLLRRLIVIPVDFSRRYSPAERRLAMAHERAHHRRGDLWWNVAALLFLAVNWFNPVAWLAFRAFRTDQELACDAAVAARASLEERCDYARALVKAATGPGTVAACAMSQSGDLKRRLRMIGRHRASPLRSAGGVAALLLAAVGGFAVAGSRPLATQAVRSPTPVRFAAASPLPPQAPVAKAAEQPKPPPAARQPHQEPAAPVRLAVAEAPAPAAPPTAAPAPLAEPNFAAAAANEADGPRAVAAQPVRLIVARQSWAGAAADPERRQRIEAAIARALAARVSSGELVRFALAEAPAGQTVVFRIRIQNDDQGE
jgi:beta-lactamase regulating signal transducer with metallopeptidase domain